MENQNHALSLSPSLNSYSSNAFAEIADNFTQEEFNRSQNNEIATEEEISHHDNDEDEDEDEDEEEDFAFNRDQQIYYDGQFPPMFPIFDRSLLSSGDDRLNRDTKSESKPSGRIQLKLLFSKEREERNLQSEKKDLEGIPSGTYCVWRPNAAEESPSRCKKSNSTGSAAKWWKFRDLLRRSNSEGKEESFVFLTPSHRRDEDRADQNNIHKVTDQISGRKFAGKVKGKGHAGGERTPSPSSSPSAHEEFYVRNRVLKEDNRKKSYLPYKQDLIGFFANVNGLSRTYTSPP